VTPDKRPDVTQSLVISMSGGHPVMLYTVVKLNKITTDSNIPELVYFLTGCLKYSILMTCKCG